MDKKKTLEELSETDKFKLMLIKTQGVKKDPSTPYLTAVITALVVGIAGVVLIVTLRPDFDILVVAGIVFAFLTPTTTSLLALLKTQETNEQAKETHLSVNSRLDAFIKQAEQAARAEGVMQGEERANLRTDQLMKDNK